MENCREPLASLGPVWTSCSTGAWGFCLAFHTPGSASSSKSCFTCYFYSQFLTFRILSLPLPSSQLWRENNWGWTLDWLFRKNICCIFVVTFFGDSKKWKNETSSPGAGSVLRVKAGHEKGHFPFLSNWLWFLRSITLECSPEMPIFLWGGSRANWFKLLVVSAGNFHQKLITASS